MSSDPAPTLDFTVATLGPYVTAAAVLHGPAAGAVAAHLDQVVQTAVKLAVQAQNAARTAMRDLPIRSFTVTGTLSITNVRNAHRTQIGVDTGESRYGADQMWTDFEDEAAAARTRAALQALVGQTVKVQKQTFYEYDHNGDHVLNDKGEKQTRTRLQPGSLHVIDAAGTETAIDLSAAAPPNRARQTSQDQRSPAKDPAAPVAADAAYGWLVQNLGQDRAQQAWTHLTVTDNHVARGQLQDIYRRYAVAATTPA